ncbi:hypothetical protein [Demequina subtropica]|uniref:hypothetical protein n=1 Tax=Demequina subtropica TaxID=1638989 RepID=UPI0007820E4D|nr:hypothetical protein [Demequina subtropica]
MTISTWQDDAGSHLDMEVSEPDNRAAIRHTQWLAPDGSCSADTILTIGSEQIVMHVETKPDDEAAVGTVEFSPGFRGPHRLRLVVEPTIGWSAAVVRGTADDEVLAPYALVDSCCNCTTDRPRPPLRVLGTGEEVAWEGSTLSSDDPAVVALVRNVAPQLSLEAGDLLAGGGILGTPECVTECVSQKITCLFGCLATSGLGGALSIQGCISLCLAAFTFCVFRCVRGLG